MEVDFAPQIIPATPEYVLSVIVDQHRQQSQIDPGADPNAILTVDTTVAQWRRACDLIPAKPLGRALNEYWRINRSDVEWESVLTPPRGRSLRGVCELIAAHAKREVIRPAVIMGRPCAPAGAFLTVRDLLHLAGADANDIAPSTPLAPFLRRYLGVFLGPISRLAPGNLPPIVVSTPLYYRAAAGFLIGWLVMVIASIAGWWTLIVLGVFMMGICYALVWAGAKSLPKSAEFGELKTFRDLANVLVGLPLTATKKTPPRRS